MIKLSMCVSCPISISETTRIVPELNCITYAAYPRAAHMHTQKTLCKRKLGTTTFSSATFILTTLSRMSLSDKTLAGHWYKVVMLSVVRLSVLTPSFIMLNVIKLYVTILGAFMLSL